MKLSKRTSEGIGCLWLVGSFASFVLQIVFLTMKLTGSVSWSWWAVLTPIWLLIGLPVVIIAIAVLVLAPKVLIENRKIRKRVEAEAKKYGMKRQPGESVNDLKKRIVRRNMITGNYSRKDIKDALMKAFPDLAGVQFFVDNQNNTIRMKVRKDPDKYITNAELLAIIKESAKYIPPKYTVAIERAKEEKHGETEN